MDADRVDELVHQFRELIGDYLHAKSAHTKMAIIRIMEKKCLEFVDEVQP